MKSALFESLNDRSNITNAYFKMVNESVEEDEDIDVDYIAGEVVDFLQLKYPRAVFIGEANDAEGNIYLKYDFSRTDTNVIKEDLIERFGDAIGLGRGKKEHAPEIGFNVIIVHPPKKVGESVEEDDVGVEDVEGWFSPQGELIREIPQECIDACTKPGADAYDDCKFWVDELGFDEGLDIAQAKGFLKSTGGWEAKEIAAFDPKETAIRLLWIICGDLKDGSDLIYIGDAEPFVEESVDVKKVKVVITGIVWPKGSSGLPERDSITIELSDGDDIEERVGQELEAEHKIAPESFKVAKVVEIDDDTTNEIIDQKELDKLTKKYDIINEKR